MKDLNMLGWISVILVLVGSIVWGLYGIFYFNLIESILGMGLLSRLVFILVGVAGGYLIYIWFVPKKTQP